MEPQAVVWDTPDPFPSGRLHVCEAWQGSVGWIQHPVCAPSQPSEHELPFPFIIPAPGKADAANTTGPTRNGEEELQKRQGKGHVLTSSPKPAFHVCAAKSHAA